MNIPGPDGPMMRVTDASGSSEQVGFVYRNVSIPEGGTDTTADVAPVFDIPERGARIIAYWGNGLGWLEKKVEAPGFDYAALLAARPASSPPTSASAGR